MEISCNCDFLAPFFKKMDFRIIKINSYPVPENVEWNIPYPYYPNYPHFIYASRHHLTIIIKRKWSEKSLCLHFLKLENVV